MGTLARITAHRATDAAVQAAFARLRDLDRCLSNYRPESELNRAAREAAQHPVRLSRDLATVLAFAQRIAVETQGAFDVSAGAVIALWRSHRQTKTLPTPTQIAEAQAVSGYQKVTLRDSTLSLATSGLAFDLGGIAKGYAATEALRVLKAHGAGQALVAIAGDIAAGGGQWRIAIQHFGRTVETVKLSNAAVSTSGDTEQFVEIDGARYSHIVDPRTGLGLVGAPAVSVIAPTGLEADALSTAAVLSGAGVLKGHGHTRAIVTPRPAPAEGQA